MSFVQHLFEYQFLSRAMLTAILVGVVCGVVGCLIILRGLSLMGDAMSHAVLPGVALVSNEYSDVYWRNGYGDVKQHYDWLYFRSFKNKKRCCYWDYFHYLLALGIVLISVIHSATDLYHILLVTSLRLLNMRFILH